VDISGNRYILPVYAIVMLDTGNGTIKNELRFEAYRKFSTDSHISFSSEDAIKTAVDPGKR
jgi:hypothetical protein